jgi:DNA-binding NarL/FixJ family response regulator
LPSGYTFVIADDHPLFRGALREAIAGIGDAPCIVEAGDFESAKTALLGEGDIDLLLLDLAMPGASGLSGLISLHGIQPSLPIVVVSAHDDPVTIRRALELGASGFISKSASMDDIRSAVRTVLDGGINLIRRLQTLTPQQTRVLSMLGEGLLNKQIAYELGVSEATVKAHVSAILQKLSVDSRTQAVIQLAKIGTDSIAAA